MIFNQDIIQDYFEILKNIAQSLEESATNTLKKYVLTELTEEVLLEICNELLLHKNILDDQSTAILKIRNEIIEYLRSFTSTGIDVEVDPNVALIIDTQNPNFTVTFKNSEGKIKRRKYALIIKSIGFKIELSIKIDIISIFGKNFNYYDTNKELKLGPGVDVGTGWLSLTICKIEELGCTLLLFGPVFGILGSISYVYQGTMAPIKD
ncbi:MAG: hypothetical protein V1646_03960 [bacterium]